MSWKCPACGNPENLDESLRCICGYEVKTEEIEKNRVKPGRIEIFSAENKLGEGTRGFDLTIRSLQITSLVAFAAFGIFAPERIKSIIPPLCLFFLMVFVIVESIVKRQVSIRIYVVKKREVPSAYNTFLFMFVIVGIVFFGKFVYELLK